ncbi:GNAT family N-acetyltransferase [Nodosilinea sp. P-1105]|uniref:GNAT family N-acetyltransferase n=1 Tax=Nodosilinea sp. P-1105 TaxID=2546229 RepID=UPI00146ACBD9|nr:GNAT family N-acetyltransferase [Nodosilinea sp. P-1105]NMF86036.1 GNAT family N-acetyltransferase [Nodosilinea sp. P-1105]
MTQDSRSIHIDRVHAHEIDEFISFYVDLFHQREPLTKCIGLSRERMLSIMQTMYARPDSHVLSQGRYWVARDRAEANRIVGFIVCDDPAAEGASQMPEPLMDQEAELLSAVMALSEEVRRPMKKMLGLGKGTCLHVAAIGVAPDYEGKGIATRLLQTALVDARTGGFRCAFAECTSLASRRLHEKSGFTSLQTVSVSTLVVNGKRPFTGCKNVDIHLMQQVLDARKTR